MARPANPGERRRTRRAILLALASSPLLTFAATQRPKKRLGILSVQDGQATKATFADVMTSLGERGYVEGNRLEIFLRFWANDGRSMNDLAHEVVAWRPDVILTEGTAATHVAKRATRSIPIVTNVADPVGAGFAASIAKPGGNITGYSQGLPEVAAKTIEVLRLMVPRLKRLAIFLYDAPVPKQIASYLENAAKEVGLEPVTTLCEDAQDAIRSLRLLPAKGVRAAYLFAFGEVAQVAREAIRARIPLMSLSESWVEGGMLASLSAFDQVLYGPRMATMIVQIFDGANPADMPFHYPQQFRFVLNRRTATALGIVVTPELLLRADRVID
jgi:putative ABC transport system substrate-binding protein